MALRSKSGMNEILDEYQHIWNRELGLEWNISEHTFLLPLEEENEIVMVTFFLTGFFLVLPQEVY